MGTSMNLISLNIFKLVLVLWRSTAGTGSVPAFKLDGSTGHF